MNKRHTLKDYIKEAELFSRRSMVVLVGVGLLCVLLLGRLFILQVWQQERYSTLSTQNSVGLHPLEPNRGLIYDRNGVLLAENIPVFSLEIIPDSVKDLDSLIEQLSHIVTISEDDIAAFKKQLRFHRKYDLVPLRLKLNEDEVARFAVDQHRFPGVFVNARLIRNYPQGQSLAHTLGFVGRINQQELQQVDSTNYAATHFIGKVGIEKFYEDTLHGTVGFEQAETDASGRSLRILNQQAPQAGKNLYLTIDVKLQEVADKALGKHRGALVAIKPDTGEILALVSKPSYDPNLFVQGIAAKTFLSLQQSKSRPLYNRAIRGQYPPASTLKPFIALQGLDTGVISPTTVVDDPGYFQLPNNSHHYRDWRWRLGGHGKVDFARAIRTSCDTYFYILANKLGIDNIDRILSQFGLGDPSHIDMGEELPGLVPGPEWKLSHKGEHWYPGDTLLTGIGQGYALATPLQLAAATAALATHGERYQPHLLLLTQNSDGSVIEAPVEPLPPVELKHPKVWGTVEAAMQQVTTSKEGTGFRFGRDAPYTVAAKTGTAQVYSSGDEENFSSKDLPENLRDHSLFIAYAPVKKPEIAVAVIIENGYMSSAVARKVMDAYLKPKVKEPASHV